MKYERIFKLKPGDDIAFVTKDYKGNRRIRQAVYRINKKTGLNLRTSERFEDDSGRTEIDRGFDEISAQLVTRIYRKE